MKSASEKPERERWDVLSGSFDERYARLKELDAEIARLEKTDSVTSAGRVRLAQLARMSREGWHELFEDIMTREG